MLMLILVDAATRKIDRAYSDFKRSYPYNEQTSKNRNIIDRIIYRPFRVKLN